MNERTVRRQPQAGGAALSRRHTMQMIGASVAALPLSFLALGRRSAAAQGAAREAGAQRTAAGRGHRAGWRWAVGGTAALAPARHYPDPFAFSVLSACTPTCTMMLGPCHDDLAPLREDISEGMPGLPMRFGIRVVDDTCQPVAGANVDVWHASASGSYSSETSDQPGFCTDGTEQTLKARYFRGHQNTNEQGIVWFSTCMPGWYAGRAVHIHVRIRRDGPGGQEYLTTQVAFATPLTHEIYQSHPDYVAHGLPDTELETDLIFDPARAQGFAVEAQRMFDGSLMTWKTIAIRSSLDSEVCKIGPADGELPGPPPWEQGAGQ